MMRKTLGTLVAAGLLILPACGDDSDDSDEPTGQDTEETTGGNADEASSTDGDDNGQATEAALGNGSDFCNDIENLALEVSQADLSSPDALQDFFERLLAIEPPAEIAADWEATTNFDLMEMDAETEAANDRIETYISEECGLDPNILDN